MAAPYRALSTRQLGDKQLVLLALSRDLPANPATANSTVTHQLPMPCSPCILVRAALSAATIAVDADGTLLAKIVKREASGDTDVDCSATLSMESDGLTAKEKAEFTLSTTVAARTFAKEDIVELDITSNSAAIDTQPATVEVYLEFVLAAE